MQGTCPNPGECQREEEGAKGQAFPKAAGRGSGLVPAACRRSSVGRLGVVRYQATPTRFRLSPSVLLCRESALTA